MSMEDLVQELKSLTEAELQAVATYVAFLKFRAQSVLPALDKGATTQPNWPGIEKTTNSSGSEAYIANTRIPVWTLESYRRLGWTEAQLLVTFPTLQAVDLVNAWAYVAAHRDEIEEALRAQEEASVL
ncbi:MAG: DUF433 domain-containing protein [Chloroflexi bacterium]|nr:DUF433 domain-containing protein [Chloroflexota bacterium]